MDEFFRNRLVAHDRKIEISKEMDEFSRNRSESPPGKLIFLNIWMSFPEFAKKG